MKALGAARRRWIGARISRVALGKYIILYASTLHVGWAALLLWSSSAGGSTPLHIIVVVAGDRYRAAFVLTVVALLAMTFPLRSYGVSNRTLLFLLIPQQTVLLLSAGAGIYAALVSHYADGVIRPWPFILSDQMPNILAALMYTAAIFEAAFEPPDRTMLDGPSQ